jgi:hypothetical protein
MDGGGYWKEPDRLVDPVDLLIFISLCFSLYLLGSSWNRQESFNNWEVSHQYEYDNEHIIKSFFFVFVMHIKWVSTESRRKSRFKRLFASIRHKPMDNMHM